MIARRWRRAMLAGVLCASADLSMAQELPRTATIEAERDRFTDDTVTTLALGLRGEKGPLPITLVITARRKRQSRPGTIDQVELRFDLPRFAGQLELAHPQVVLRFDEGTRDETHLELNTDERQDLRMLDRVVFGKFDLSDLSRLARAATFSGRFFGYAFAMNDEQMRAINDFTLRALK